MAFLPKLRPRRSVYAFVMIRLFTFVTVSAQLLLIGIIIRQFTGSGDTMDTTIFALYTTRLFNLAAFLPTFLACYLRPATLRRWSLALGLLCAINFGPAVVIRTRIPEDFGAKHGSSMDLAFAGLMMVAQVIHLGVPWLSYGPAEYDEPVLRPETLNAEFEDDSVPLDRKAQESKVRSLTCSLPCLPQLGPLPSSR